MVQDSTSGGTLALVLNAGSSSLKYQVVDPASGVARVRGTVERIGTGDVSDHDAALELMRADLQNHDVSAASLTVIGHRVVHGGPDLVAPTVVDDDVLSEIDDLARLAPLHNPPAAAGIRSARGHYPDVPQVAAFDTAFFADLPAAAATYALPSGLTSSGLRRYGAHGISHQYVAAEVAAFLDVPIDDLDQIVLHLGNGASASAISGGRPVETSMGLTPLEGLVMGTRAGDLDPGLLLHLLRHGDLDSDGLEDVLHHRSGLLGMAGTTDLRDLLDAIDRRDERAKAAYDVYVHRVRKYLGAYLAVLGGADVVTFTAGVGEHSPRVRAGCLRGLERLGIVLDEARNEAGAGARRISADDSPVTVLVVPTNEELAIARQAVALVGG
ncbi:acetate/propionate family kinase [Nocardioides lianchengensis]|uniref:Acetate kinase n=1 Tax=Nocardioides lianchengensis TaxID=1045774 RepID=A0A1G7C1B8_9ACTN|nr:acetate kinase [Nocardioides lianchengensis]NYG09276.1 acetate kinase [Nocardioides lianchengensis]SDE33154.1 acetate kinase [Nocardioides lianchengensis]